MGGNGPGLLGARNHQPRCQGARHRSSVSPSAPEPGINKGWEAGRRPRRPGQLEEDLIQFQASFVLLLTQDVLQFGDHGQVLTEAPPPPVSGGPGITFSPRTHFAGLLPLPPPSRTPRRQMREHRLLLIFSLFVLPLFTRHVHTVLRAHRWAEDQSPLCCPSQPPSPPRTWAEAPAPGALLLGVDGGPGNVSPNTMCETEGWGRGQEGVGRAVPPAPKLETQPGVSPHLATTWSKNYKKLGDHHPPLLPELPWGGALDSLLTQKSCLESWELFLRLDFFIYKPFLCSQLRGGEAKLEPFSPLWECWAGGRGRVEGKVWGWRQHAYQFCNLRQVGAPL